MAEKTGEDGQEVKRHYSKEDILSAGDVGAVLEAYRRAYEQRHRYERVSDLQKTVADRFHQLGEEEKSYEFTLLASETQNSEGAGTVVEQLDQLRSEFAREVTRLTEASEKIRGSGTQINDAGERIQSAGDFFSRAVDRMDTASRTIDTASHRMNQ